MEKDVKKKKKKKKKKMKKEKEKEQYNKVMLGIKRTIDRTIEAKWSLIVVAKKYSRPVGVCTALKYR